MSLVETTAERILAAYKGAAIPPVRETLTSKEDAYAVQQATVRTWLSQGRRIVGRKIGLTSKAVQTQLGVDEPDFGTLFDDMVVANGGVIAAGSVKQPRVEAEVAFVLGADLNKEHVSAEDVIAATSYVCPALEICGSRIEGWNIRIADTIADNASSGMIVLGKSAGKLSLDELPTVEVHLAHNGKPAQQGRGEACLGNPAIAVAWLAETLARFGDGLKAGDIVMSGALAAMLPAAPGDRFEADFGRLGAVAVSFAK